VIDNIFLQNAGKQLHFLWSNDFWISGNQYGITTGSPVPAFGCYLDNSSAGTYTQNYHWNNNIGLSRSTRTTTGSRMTGSKSRAFKALCCNRATRPSFPATRSTRTTNRIPRLWPGFLPGMTNLDRLRKPGVRLYRCQPGAFAYSFGAGCANLTVRGNQSTNFATAPYFIDSSLSQQAFNADFALAAKQQEHDRRGDNDFMAQLARTAGGGARWSRCQLGERCSAVQIIAESNLAPAVGQTFTYTLMVNNVASSLVATTSGALFC